MSVETEVDSLSGTLGRLVAQKVISRQGATAVKKAAVTDVKKEMGVATMTPTQKFLIAKTPKADVNIQRDIKNGNSLFEDVDVYVRQKVAGGGSISLIKSSDMQKIGTRNLQGNSLPMGTFVAFDRFKFSYATHATETDPAAVYYTNAMDAETAGSSPVAIPAAILNGEVELKVNNVSRWRLPAKKFFRESLSVGVGTEGLQDVVKLASPIIIEGGQTMELILHCAEGLSLSTSASHFVEGRFMGTGITPR